MRAVCRGFVLTSIYLDCCPAFLLSALTFDILRLLSDGAFHSGEALAQRLDLSRASVWQALQGVEQYGVEIHSVRGKGYRLSQPIEWLDAARIAAAAGDAGKRLSLALFDQLESSNSVLLRRAAQCNSGTVLACEWQSAGRGRLGRQWLGNLGGSLLFSLLWRFEQGVAGLSGLSLAVGVALVRALRLAGITDARLKWPNDVFLPQGKLAGILIEVSGDTLGPSQVVIGVGLNLRLGQMQRQIGQPVAALGQPVSRNLLLGLLLQQMLLVLDQFSVHGFAVLREEWQSMHYLHQQPVRLLAPNGTERFGVVQGVAEDVTLLLDEAGVLERIHAGEISLREC